MLSILSLLWALLGAPAAHSTSFYEQPFVETIREAPAVVRGKVGGKYSDWSKGEEVKRLYTYHELQVEEVLKGRVDSATIQVRELGGEKDGVGMQVSGSAHFERGEDVVVLLNGEKNPDGSYTLRGLMMGKYGVSRGPEGAEILSGPGLIGTPPQGVSQNPGDTGSARWTLDALRQVIRSQGGAAEMQPNQPANQSVSSPTPVVPAPSGPTDSTAPQLQPSTSEDAPTVGGSSESNVLWIGLGLGGLGLLAFLWLIRSKRE